MQFFLKRLIDLILAIALLVLTSPLLLLTSFLVLIFDGTPVFFRQLRPGLNGKIFKIYKFRTMRNQLANQNLNDHERSTRLGKIIRNFSIDELPQLLNVISGDLSLVGPRPLLVEYLPLYNERQKKRHNVKPGITGWAQINGRNAIGWEQKFEYDIWYVENWSIFLDLKIIFLTFVTLVNRSGINASNNVTMEKFKGSK